MDPNTPAPVDPIGVVILVLFYGVPFVLFVVAGIVGALIERAHYRSIRTREAATAALPVVSLRQPDPTRTVAESMLVTSSVVVSHDNFKRFVAQLKKIFGGRLRSYESLLDRARREAVLRLKEQCPHSHIILNLRLDTANVASLQGKKGIGAIEVLASGTAVRYTD